MKIVGYFILLLSLFGKLYATTKGIQILKAKSTVEVEHRPLSSAKEINFEVFHYYIYSTSNDSFKQDHSVYLQNASLHKDDNITSLMNGTYRIASARSKDSNVNGYAALQRPLKCETANCSPVYTQGDRSNDASGIEYSFFLYCNLFFENFPKNFFFCLTVSQQKIRHTAMVEPDDPRYMRESG